MTSPTPRSEPATVRTSLARLAVAGVASLTLLAACGSDSGSKPAATTTEPPEEKTVPDAQVTAGLATLQATMSKLAASPELATNGALDELLGGWAAIEGIIKQNEVDMYLSFEDALAAFTKAGKAKDAAAMAAAAAAFATTAKAYLAEHP